MTFAASDDFWVETGSHLLIEPEEAQLATFELIHGAGDSAWYWHLLEPELRERGHEVVTMDLPCDDDSAGLTEYLDTVIDAIGDRRDLVPVAQSFGGFTAPLVCERVSVDLMVLLAAMIPARGRRRTTIGRTRTTPRPGEARATPRMTSRRRLSPPSSTTFLPSWRRKR
jgi:pimeloyl-ACP methyl ester carboxylesterase